MAEDVVLADLVGSLFFPAVADAGGAVAADVGLGAAADVGLGAAADVGAGLGAAELGAGGAGLAGEIAAGTAPEVLASAAPAIAAGDVGGQIAAEGSLAGLGAAADAAVPLGVDIASSAALGDTVGLPASQALDFAPTAADFAGSAQPFEVGAAAPGTAGGAVSSAAPTSSAAAVASPAQALAGDTNIAANLGSDVPLPADLGGETALPTVTPDAAAALASAAPAAAPAAAGAAAPAAAGGGVLGTLGSIASNPLAQMAVPGGFLAYNLLKGPPGIPSDAQSALNNAGSTLPGLEAAATKNTPMLQNTASTDLNLANNFQISPAQSAALETWKQNQYNQLRQQIANQNPGNPNIEASSEWVQGKNQIDQQALGQQTQMIDQLISTAFQAQTAAEASISSASTINDQMNRLLMQAAQLQVQQDASFNQAVGSAMQAFGLIAGLNAAKFAKPSATA